LTTRQRERDRAVARGVSRRHGNGRGTEQWLVVSVDDAATGEGQSSGSWCQSTARQRERDRAVARGVSRRRGNGRGTEQWLVVSVDGTTTGEGQSSGSWCQSTTRQRERDRAVARGVSRRRGNGRGTEQWLVVSVDDTATDFQVWPRRNNRRKPCAADGENGCGGVRGCGHITRGGV
jgi:hypothetical protein